jgi:glycosidase
MKTKSMTVLLLSGLLALVLIVSWSCTNPKTEEPPVFTRPVSEVVTPEWAIDASIYEVNVRQFTPEGTFNAFAGHLPRLKDLGVEILWFMPIHPIGELNRKGGLGSYYSVKDYTAVNPEFGTFDDFKLLVEKAHEMGFKVILDWVANHTAWDHEWMTQHPEWYNRDENGNVIAPFDWTDVADLKFEDNMPLWEAMTEEMKFWVREANIDGYRCDVAGMVPAEFWNQARIALNEIKPVFMLAEDEGERSLMLKAFDANYGWEMHHIMNQIAKGEKNAADMWTYFRKNDSIFPESSYRMYFTSNHDENSWNGTEFERMGEGTKAFAVLSYTVPGFPLIYNGQEVSLQKRLLFFEKDEIDWKGTDISGFYKTLNQLKKDNPVLWNGANGGKMRPVKTDNPTGIFSFARKKDDAKLFVFINMTGAGISFTIEDDKADGLFTDVFDSQQVQLNNGTQLTLPAWGYLVLR